MRPRLDRIGVWHLALFTLSCIAAAWRFAYLARLRHTAFAASLDADALVYWNWSESILRHGVTPEAPFFLAPLYPYVLAAVRAATGGGIPSVLAFQAVLGAGAVALLADATARVAGRFAALAVGIVLALFQSATFFDALVLPESLLFFLESVLVWFVVRTDWPSASLGRYATYGLLVGVLAQGRASNAVLLALVVLLTRRIPSLAAAIVAFALCCAPSMVANFRVSRELIPLTYNLGFNLYIGNNPDADGAYVDVTAGSIPVPLAGTSGTTGGALDGRAFLLATEGRRLTPAESSPAWTRKAMEYVRSAPLSAAGLAGKKLLLAWNYRAIPQIESMASIARSAGPLGLPLIGSFGFLAIIGLTGVACSARRSVSERWLVGYLALMSLAMAPFFVTDRYRHHLVPALAVLAGFAIVEVARVVRSGSSNARVRAAVAGACAAAIVFAPIEARDSRLGDWAFAADDAIRLLDHRRYDEAAEAFARAETALRSVPPDSLSMSARTAVASFYLRYGIALESLGRRDDAIARWERAIDVNPNDAASLGRLLLAYERDGRSVDAARVRRSLESTPGGSGLILLNDAWAAAGRGDLARAEALFLQALHAAPDLPMAWEGLIRLRIQTSRYDDAARTLEEARGSGLDATSGDIYACYLAVARGDLVAARRASARIPRAPPNDAVLARLLNSSRRALRENP
jgi:tetratricopeptide (TPR) repeat protein